MPVNRATRSKLSFALLVAAVSGCSASFNEQSAPTSSGDQAAVVQLPQLNVQPALCSVSAGTWFTARLDHFLGTDSSRPGETFTARVVAPVMSSCHFAFIRAGVTVRGRITCAEPGQPPVLALEL